MLTSYEAKKIIIGLQRVAAGKSKELYDYLNKFQFQNPKTPAGRALIEIVKKRMRDAERQLG